VLDKFSKKCSETTVPNGHTMQALIEKFHETGSVCDIKRSGWFLQFIANNNEDILDVTFFTDEARFHLNGYMNSENRRIWSAHNPHCLQQTALHRLKVGVWVAISRKRIIGPIFFYKK
jgi:hypothetical protein